MCGGVTGGAKETELEAFLTAGPRSGMSAIRMEGRFDKLGDRECRSAEGEDIAVGG